MSPEALRQLIALGEGFRVEFKRKVPTADKLAKTLVAFANSQGGHILIGIDDNRTVIGVRSPEEAEFEIEQAARHHCDPPIDYALELIAYAGREVLVIYVPESSRKPHFRIGPEGRTAFVRVQDKSLEAGVELVHLLREERKERPLRLQYGPHEEQLFRYLNHYERITVRQFSRMVNISLRRASRILVTLMRAGVLRLHQTERGAFFTLAHELPENGAR
ncbi:MAG: ATP-binding protein [Bacteroidetes bacterium]|nr:ATP-binding protein [Rhodothermia bacterium]MCS7155800.1 ATP-binding protein [Bacteroidota bacterium]MCX7906099.1 ATP-binding protein [Bacteroidota bacterium]MDW8138227.1 ATP-binding protein [Bacteroidota bacterium]MDW8285911.1 ATP-binding protein [Bacteroidota bacterium]